MLILIDILFIVKEFISKKNYIFMLIMYIRISEKHKGIKY